MASETIPQPADDTRPDGSAPTSMTGLDTSRSRSRKPGAGVPTIGRTGHGAPALTSVGAPTTAFV